MSSCTFFGHHDCPSDIKPKLRELLIRLIETQGVDKFYVGTHGNFDHLAHSCLQELSVQYPQLRYCVVLAYLPQKESEWTNTLFPEGIELVPKRFAISWRNRWMLEHSDGAVLYIRHRLGGAAQFAKLAERQGKQLFPL